MLELMELQMERRTREEHRLKADLDPIQQEMSALKLSRLQIQAEVFFFYATLQLRPPFAYLQNNKSRTNE